MMKYGEAFDIEIIPEAIEIIDQLDNVYLEHAYGAATKRQPNPNEIAITPPPASLTNDTIGGGEAARTAAAIEAVA